MITIRRVDMLGTIQEAGVDLRCHFAFGSFQDAAYVHDGRLRVVNAMRIASGAQFRLGAEQNVDIVTWVADGALSATSGLFPSETITTGGLHAISTASGCQSFGWRAGPVGASCLQFWFLADNEGGEPSQETRPDFPEAEEGSFRIIASGFPEDDPEGAEAVIDGSPVTLRSRSRLLRATLRAGEGALYRTTPGRTLYMIVAKGAASLGREFLAAGDAARIDGQEETVVLATQDAVILLADTANG
ncbi:hypothetical protein J2D73_03180 [Acetobacter sacchari]|uniref:Quercetin 2,3-dioxygenase C-terminal cupin domain-containing protein n=1 Tax=Acetobacter sacchari TaxID=2661687 RepID=A0ABS3LSA4_9PROT|nr:hypothetical protein [Acetobacter sacchari]MBO1358802.1 hypothetical protein [Acetobacter sacchari]